MIWDTVAFFFIGAGANKPEHASSRPANQIAAITCHQQPKNPKKQGKELAGALH
jgi:hypothetical protein